MIGHLGSRISALLDGQMSPAETERAWEHVHSCHACRDLVEREGWVKTRLAGLTYEETTPSTPDWLKGSLMGAPQYGPAGAVYLQHAGLDNRRRTVGLVALGSGAVGAAFVGVLAFGVAPASAPTIDRPAPASINNTDVPRTPAATQPSAFTRSRR